MKLLSIILLLSISVFASNKVVIADFEELEENKFPKGWGIKKGLWYTSGKGNKTWKIKKEGNNKYISALSKKDSFTIGKKYEYSMKKYKYISWKWRVHEFPEGGDEKKKNTGDSAAGVYIVFPGFVVPYSIKYVWSATRKAGTVVDSPFTGRTKIIVVRTGKEEFGRWFEEKRNVYEDFKNVFKVKKPDKNPSGIALLTDSDNTGTRACADYDDIIAATE